MISVLDPDNRKEGDRQSTFLSSLPLHHTATTQTITVNSKAYSSFNMNKDNQNQAQAQAQTQTQNTQSATQPAVADGRRRSVRTHTA
jgi:hypothetical protein